MRIQRVDVHPVAMPLSHPYRDATRVETHSRDVLVRITTDDGAEGWGAAAPRVIPTGETQVGTTHVLNAVLGPLLIGTDPFEIEAAHELMGRAIAGNHAAKAAIDIALFDLVGRCLGRPVHDLLGGRLRSAMPTLDILPLDEPPRMAELALRLRETRGTRAFKVKIDADLAMGVARIAAVRDALGEETMLVVDANGTWSVKESLEASRQLEPHAVAVIEQPTPGDDLDALATVTARTDVRISADESARPELVGRLLSMRAADLVNVKLTREGGLLPARRVAGAAQLLGMGVVAGSVVQNALIDAACAHFFAATPGIVYNESGKASSWHAEDVATGLHVRDGLVHVPDGPGLGVTVDESAVRRLRPDA
jgi:L-alanine-DL-glutamate epimerase-like enolase superfamily enzyme